METGLPVPMEKPASIQREFTLTQAMPTKATAAAT